jgi:hypothetical protein
MTSGYSDDGMRLALTRQTWCGRSDFGNALPASLMHDILTQ